MEFFEFLPGIFELTFISSGTFVIDDVVQWPVIRTQFRQILRLANGYKTWSSFELKSETFSPLIY